jgi:hypothetical protein
MDAALGTTILRGQSRNTHVNVLLRGKEGQHGSDM